MKIFTKTTNTLPLLFFGSLVLFFEGYQKAAAANTCDWGKFQCSNGKCTKYTFRCDKGDDCGDNSDETGCGEECPNNYFRCSNGRCVTRMHLCQGDDDCGDNSDETQHLCGSGSAPLICYYCNVNDSSSCSQTVKCSRSRGFSRCARFTYIQNGSNIMESTCATKSECTPPGIQRKCKIRGEDCRMQCCDTNRCNQPLRFDHNIWSPKLACYQCNVHNWEKCVTKVTCAGNEGFTRCFKMSYKRIEAGKELSVTRTGCATQSNCTAGHNLCEGHEPNCNLRCCDNSSCNAPSNDETTSNSNLKCYKCSSKTSYQDCNTRKVLQTCNDNEDRCLQAQVKTDKNGGMFYKGCTLTSKCNSTTLDFCRSHNNSSSCTVKCCSEDKCNAGSNVVFSWFVFMTCTILYFYIGLPV